MDLELTHPLNKIPTGKRVTLSKQKLNIKALLSILYHLAYKAMTAN